MKLIRFALGDAKPSFGVVGDHAVAFEIFQSRSGITRPGLCDSNAPLVGPPESEQAGKLLPSRWPVRPALQKFHG